MPSASDIAELRGANTELSRRVQNDLSQFWSTLDLSKPEKARNALLRYIPSLTTTYGDSAALMAADWYDAVRAADGVAGKFAAEQAEAFAKEWVEDRVRYGSRHLFTDQPDQMLKFLDGAVQEYALKPGRDTITRASIQDPSAAGWGRHVRGDACEFCRMLAGRGAVYRSETVEFKAHGHCNCVPQPEWADGAATEYTPKAPAAPVKPAGTGGLPQAEPEFVDRLEGLLRTGKVTPAQLREQGLNASPLAQANVSAAIERFSTARTPAGRSFTSAQEARDWADSYWAGPNGYPPDELDVLRSYTASAYGPMNNTLRSSKGKRTTKEIRTMDSAMDRAARVPDDITVVRNANLRQLGITRSKQDPKTIVGQEFVDYGYLSTSINRRGSMEGEVRLEIKVPKGARGVYVSGKGGPKSANIISDFGGGESELILDRGSMLRIRSVKKSGKRWHVVADLVQTGANR